MARADWQYNEIVTEIDLNQLGQEINEKETILGAQEKAQQAEENAKAYTDVEIGQVSDAVTSHAGDKLQHTGYATASGTNTYTASIPGIASLAEGLSVKIKFINANTAAATLNINSLGSVSIRKGNGSTLSSGNIKAGQIVHLVYTGSVFQLLGEGGEYGTAVAAEVLAGKTVGTENGLVTGTMANRGAVSHSLPINGTYTVPSGYHNGSGSISQSIPTKAAATITPGTANQTIAAGQYLSGVQTIASLGGNAAAGHVLTGHTFSSNSAGRAVSGTMANRGAVSQTLTTQSGQYTIPAGYHSGSGKVTASFPNLIAANVKQGVNIGGVVGSLVEGIPLSAGTDREFKKFSFSNKNGNEFIKHFDATFGSKVSPGSTATCYLYATGSSYKTRTKLYHNGVEIAYIISSTSTGEAETTLDITINPGDVLSVSGYKEGSGANSGYLQVLVSEAYQGYSMEWVAY